METISAKVYTVLDWLPDDSAEIASELFNWAEETVKRAGRWPNAGRPVVIAPDGTIANRKTPVGGFPWAVGYEVSDDKLIVLAVFHQHRKPDYWTDRTHA